MNIIVPVLSVAILLQVSGEPIRPLAQNGALGDTLGHKKDSLVNNDLLKEQNNVNGMRDLTKKKNKIVADDAANVIKPKSQKRRKKKRTLKSSLVKTNITNENVHLQESQNIPKQPQDSQDNLKAVDKNSVHGIEGDNMKPVNKFGAIGGDTKFDKNVQQPPVVGQNSLSNNVKQQNLNQNAGIQNDALVGQQNNPDQKVHELANQNQQPEDSSLNKKNVDNQNQVNPPTLQNNLPAAGGNVQHQNAVLNNPNPVNQNAAAVGNPPGFAPHIEPNQQQPVVNNVNNNVNNNNINNNINNNNNNMGIVQPNIQPINVVRQPPKKEDSLRIVWDWSDFLINYEQYVMPEQKVRRAPHATTGEPWPLPQYYVPKANKLYKLDKEKFRFNIIKETCDVIEKAIERYRDVIIEDTIQDMYDNLQHAQGTSIDDITSKYDDEIYMKAQPITTVNVKIRRPCSKFPNDQMDESYDVFVKKTGSYIWANEVWGALRGLETFSQIVFRGTDDNLYIKDTVINDYPRFPHRGLLIDTSRHYIFKEVFYDILEGMAQNKMNVLHWHIVDDQSFPYQSKIYPDLSEKGAYHPSFVYSHEDIADIIEYARMRGIRVMPEFDTPGHTYSWGLSHPHLLTQCYQGAHPVNGYLGPLDPSKNETYRFLKTFFSEVLHVFKEQYIHLGGDEVPMTCWSSNPEVLRLLNKLDGKPDAPINLQNNDPYLYSYDIRKVLEFYEKRLTTDLKDVGRKRKNGVRFVMWQEIMNNNVQLPNDTIIQIWQGDMGDVQRAIDMGYNTLYSTCWYLDLIEYGTKWPKYYNCDPADTSLGYQIDEKKVLGGEACLWAEYIDNENLMTTLWPRASAAAERLWSSKDVRDIEAAGRRLQEHRCRMLSRGLSVGQISGPDYCLRRGHRRDGERMTNCTGDRCHSFRNSVQIEKFNIHVQQRGHSMAECNQMLANGGSMLSIVLIIVILVGVLLSLKMSGNRIVQIKICRNKTMFIAFITLIVIYFMCYTSLWMQVQEFKGSFEKRVKSYSDNKIS